MRIFLCATKIVPHPELVEGRTLIMQAMIGRRAITAPVDFQGTIE
jgi:hypothetical protein